MRVAFVHEWLIFYAGSDRLLEHMLKHFPDADIFTLVDFMPEDQRGFLKGRSIQTSFIQNLPFARRNFRKYLPLFPFAVEQFDLSGYDLVISNSFSVAKGAMTGPDQLHICMCCSPIRYAWDLENDYLADHGAARGFKSWLIRWVLHKIRIWDAASAFRVDHYFAISKFVAARIRKYYGRSAHVIYPPIDVQNFALHPAKDDFYLAASRLVPYKKMHVIVEAFRRMPQRRLIVIGDGPESATVARSAAGCANITLLGYQPTPVLRDHMQRAKAFLFAAKEDFGIIVLEAQATGTPVIAFGKGGATETIRGLGDDPNPTGLFFDEQTPEAIIDAVERFEQSDGAITPGACRDNALRFTPERFHREFAATVEDWLTMHRRATGAHPANNKIVPLSRTEPASRA